MTIFRQRWTITARIGLWLHDVGWRLYLWSMKPWCYQHQRYMRIAQTGPYAGWWKCPQEGL